MRHAYSFQNKVRTGAILICKMISILEIFLNLIRMVPARDTDVTGVVTDFRTLNCRSGKLDLMSVFKLIANYLIYL